MTVTLPVVPWKSGVPVGRELPLVNVSGSTPIVPHYPLTLPSPSACAVAPWRSSSCRTAFQSRGAGRSLILCGGSGLPGAAAGALRLLRVGALGGRLAGPARSRRRSQGRLLQERRAFYPQRFR